MLKVNTAQLKEILNKNWMTHDGMWFYHCLRECGIFDRVEGWLEGMGIRYPVTPQVEGCMMHTDGCCNREFRLKFPNGVS